MRVVKAEHEAPRLYHNPVSKRPSTFYSPARADSRKGCPEGSAELSTAFRSQKVQTTHATVINYNKKSRTPYATLLHVWLVPVPSFETGILRSVAILLSSRGERSNCIDYLRAGGRLTESTDDAAMLCRCALRSHGSLWIPPRRPRAGSTVSGGTWLPVDDPISRTAGRVNHLGWPVKKQDYNYIELRNDEVKRSEG